MNEELQNIFEETKYVIRKQDLSDKTIKYLLAMVSKDIEIASKKFDKLEKALDKACDIIAHEHLSFSTYTDSKEDWKEFLLEESEK